MLAKLFFINIVVLTVVEAGLPVVKLQKTYAPDAGDQISRNYSVRLKLQLNVTVSRELLDDLNKYRFWTYDGTVPGPLIRTRVGDVLDVALTNYATVRHGVDFHAAIGPGGGEPVLQAAPNSTQKAAFKMMFPGLYFYHCGTPPVPMHLSNGMYGLLLVEPLNSLPPVDKEFYIMRSEFYTDKPSSGMLHYAEENGLDEVPQYVVFNGKTTSLIEKPLEAKTNDWIRIYFGNAGPNQVASFHIIGVIFNKVYREGDLTSKPAKNIQTTLVPAGGSVVVEFQVLIPGNYTIVDHSIFRITKGAVGIIIVNGPSRPDLYCSHTDGTCLSDEIDDPTDILPSSNSSHDMTTEKQKSKKTLTATTDDFLNE